MLTNLNWDDQKSEVLVNPAYSEFEKLKFSRIATASGLNGHIWLATSGSLVQKWVGISKAALLCSAAAVNDHFNLTASDVWGLALPTFHVAGISILARAYLSNAKVCHFSSKWSATDFINFLKIKNISICSLVPKQVADLLSTSQQPPSTLKAIIVGGGALDKSLLDLANSLGWPLFASYGMTECGSQIATASKANDPQLKILPHLTVNVRDKRLVLAGGSLFTCYATFEENKMVFFDPKVDGQFFSNDRGLVQNGFLKIFGRTDDVVKVLGENVDLANLESIFKAVAPSLSFAIIAKKDAVRGHKLALFVENNSFEQHLAEKALAQYNNLVMPFEKIDTLKLVSTFPRSSLGKILKKSDFFQSLF